jgi:hypothetical protein
VEEEALLRGAGLYSAEALAAVGLGLSPSHAYHPNEVTTSEDRERHHELRNHHPFRGPSDESIALRSTQAPPPVARLPQQQQGSQGPVNTSNAPQTFTNRRTVSHPPPPSSKQEFIEFKVLRAWSLPECLGGTNAYVIIKMPGYGEGRTQAVSNSTEPFFGAMFTIRSPLKPNASGSLRSHIDDADDLVNMADDQDGSWTKVQVLIYNKNASISDELIAIGEQDIGSLLEQSQFSPVVMELFDSNRQPNGYIELMMRCIQK